MPVGTRFSLANATIKTQLQKKKRTRAHESLFAFSPDRGWLTVVPLSKI